MSDDMLSQDEIDALLNATDDEQDSSENDTKELTSLEKDALGEIGNISFGNSTTALSSLLNQKVEITTPELSVVSRSQLPNEFPKPHVAVGVTYTEGFTGENVLVIKSEDASIIADLMLGGDGSSPDDHLNEIALSAVQEAMNQMMGSAATSMSTIFNKKVDITPPTIDVLNYDENEGTEQIPNEDILVKVAFQIKVGDLINSKIMQLIPIDFAKELVEELMNPPEEEEKKVSEPSIEQDLPVSKPQKEEPRDTMQPTQTATETQQPKRSAQDDQEKSAGRPQYVGGRRGQTVDDADIQSAEFQNFDSFQLNNVEQRNLDMLMDIPLKVTVELGRTKRTIKEILEISEGSVVELDKLAGEPVDILVNDKLMAKGEVVVIDENFGVRVTDILSQRERLSQLR
ncbi:flagellar motor switch phosphatase FliY [Halobacillus yeomjeoni]|uniref:flagellar motor switch phosphatase FliY n=1 Tax=Halobacillus yeomjeoni TaxID=311194 RepID=UPI001CD7C71D|nr:flagellar motor switch phosphatase FliY [Halobacillus yeomjeoni]MCA0983319.1 flagellar motor switch phosphatase FliY [Halobacillus yeomjeoni]